jgi:hypothetical protein
MLTKVQRYTGKLLTLGSSSNNADIPIDNAHTLSQSRVTVPLERFSRPPSRLSRDVPEKKNNLQNFASESCRL